MVFAPPPAALPTPIPAAALEMQEVSMAVSVGGRPRKSEIERRRKNFVGLLASGVDPATAAEISRHPAERALKTLSELGFVLSVLEPEERAA